MPDDEPTLAAVGSAVDGLADGVTPRELPGQDCQQLAEALGVPLADLLAGGASADR